MGRKDFVTEEKLEPILDKILCFAAENGINIIECSEIFIEDSIQFGNLENFYKTIESLKEKPKSIFISKEYGNDYNTEIDAIEKFQKYENELGQIKACVQSENGRYLFLKYTVWSFEMVNWHNQEPFDELESNEAQENIPVKSNIEYDEKLKNEITSFIDEILKQNPSSVYDISQGGGEINWKIYSMVDDKYQIANTIKERERLQAFIGDALHKKINEILQKENEQLEIFAEKITIWARQKKIYRLTNAHMKMAMANLSLYFSKFNSDIVKDRVNAAIKQQFSS